MIVLSGYALIVGPDVSYGASADQTALLEQIQEQIITFRQEFKQRMTRTDEDRQAVYENLQQKFEELTELQASYLEVQPEILKKIQTLSPVLEQYEQQIDELEAMLNSMEATMSQNLDAIESELLDIKKHGVRRPQSRVASPGSRLQEGEQAGDDEMRPSPLDQLSEGELFRLAYQFFRDREYEVAIGGFQKFLTEFPQSQLAGAAQYWIAESFNNLEEYQIAIEEYDHLLAKYPGTDKSSDAHYGIGVAQARLGNMEEARAKFQYVINQYPGTIAAQKAQRRLEEF